MSEMLYKLEAFTPLLNQTFDLVLDDQHTFPLELIAAEPGHPQASLPGRATFSLTWRGPVSPFFPQRIYRLHHPQTGDLELFIVPVGQDRTGIQYEAVFT